MVFNKLKSNDFKSLREQGKTFKTPNFLFVYELSPTSDSLNQENTVSIGFTITRKIGKAFLRNKLRRLMRESIREHFRSNDQGLREGNLNLKLNIVVLNNKKPENLAYSNVQEQINHFFKTKVLRE